MSDQIRALKSEWDALQPIKPEHEHRLWQKLRLEWNYHSNHIEGNTLTYGETALLLLHGQTHGNHTLREYEEMKAHDVGIEHLRNLAADHERLIGPGDVRDLNRIILKEPFWKPTQTPDGRPTRVEVIPGEYKTLPNSVVTLTGEIFEYASPQDVPPRMQELVEWLGESLDQFREADLLWILAKLHHDFVLIHPFDDGNGRVARMLVNYVLLRRGYPPLIVPTEAKKDYLAALRLADAGEPEELEQFFGNCLTRTLQLGIKAGRGETITEPGDVEKEVALLVRNQGHHREKVQPKSKAAISSLYESGLKDLIVLSLEKMNAFESLFLNSRVNVDPRKPNGNNDPLRSFSAQLAEGFEKPKHFMLTFKFLDYRGEAKSPFSAQTFYQIVFNSSQYKLSVANRTVAQKLYSEPLLAEERETILDRLMKDVLDQIKAKSGKK